jgi:hypothetical protein
MSEGTGVQCRLCAKDIENDSLFCRFCHAVFHRACIVDHLYYNGTCPECKKEISLFDLEIGTPGEYIHGKIRKPLWPQSSEVPLFEEVTLKRVTVKKIMPQEVTPLPSQKILSTPKKSFTKGLKSFYLPEKLIKGFKQSKKGMFGLYMLLIVVVPDTTRMTHTASQGACTVHFQTFMCFNPFNRYSIFFLVLVSSSISTIFFPSFVKAIRVQCLFELMNCKGIRNLCRTYQIFHVEARM